MIVTMLKSKLHKATVTDADLNYEGSVSIDPALIDAAGFLLSEQVDIYNITNGQRFTTYVIEGKKGEICLNGAAARLVHRGDKVIIASYAQMTLEEARGWKPRVILLGDSNEMKGTAK
jgi:aspartate 1-decarboxylase